MHLMVLNATIAAYVFQEGYISMGGGFPNPLTFPIVEADFKLRLVFALCQPQKLFEAQAKGTRQHFND